MAGFGDEAARAGLLLGLVAMAGLWSGAVRARFWLGRASAGGYGGHAAIKGVAHG